MNQWRLRLKLESDEERGSVSFAFRGKMIDGAIFGKEYSSPPASI
ncbi:hypothetical protein X751_15725 [Mesorhizobium sp. LNJC395A00]|nr:hypothetical protein X751_15725 [Mesorhizobium sp. LNJC395A00]